MHIPKSILKSISKGMSKGTLRGIPKGTLWMIILWGHKIAAGVSDILQDLAAGTCTRTAAVMHVELWPRRAHLNTEPWKSGHKSCTTLLADDYLIFLKKGRSHPPRPLLTSQVLTLPRIITKLKNIHISCQSLRKSTQHVFTSQESLKREKLIFQHQRFTKRLTF